MQPMLFAQLLFLLMVDIPYSSVSSIEQRYFIVSVCVQMELNGKKSSRLMVGLWASKAQWDSILMRRHGCEFEIEIASTR